MSSSILNIIQHYQKSIEHSQHDETRLMHCINKLYNLPVKVEHLQQTGVGKTVNSLRKFNGEIGVAAKALVTKWKAMVAAEEEPADADSCQGNEDDDMNNGNGHSSSDDDHYNHNHSESKRTAHEHVSKISSKKGASNDRDSKYRDKSKAEHKTKSSNEEKSHKSSSRHNKRQEPEEKEMSSTKKVKSERINENKKSETDQRKSTEEKSSRHGESSEKQNSSKDAKTTSPFASNHHKSSGSSREKRENHKGEKRSEHSSSSKHQSKLEKTNKHDESGKHRSPKEKEKPDRSKESKQDKISTSSKDTSHREKHHKSSTSHSSSSAGKPVTCKSEQSSSSSSHKKSESSSTSTSRKRQLDDDSNDAAQPKAKLTKTPKTTKVKSISNDEEDDVEPDNGIDSSMGANFADVLGMLNMPTKKAKKNLNNNKSPTVNTPRSSGNEKPSTSSNSIKNTINEYKPSTTSSSSNSTKPKDAKPELLSASAKLAPLDPSIALELPTISANYRPLPQNKTVMDCIYRNSGAVLPTPKPVRILTDDEAISHGISSKQMRTKIYSGVRSGQLFQVPALFDLCTRVLQKNIDALEYTGGVPFDVLRPVLERATPHQLLIFEEYNPYLMDDSDCLWQIHVQRNYRSNKRLEMETWREMFLRCEDEKEQKLNSLTATIKQSQKIIAAPVRKTQMAFVDALVKPPRNVLRKQEQYGTKGKLVATPAARVAALSSVTPNAGKVGDARLRVAASVRDAAQVSHAPIRAKKAPLMAKTLQFMRGRHKR
ncbi:transcription elongation factor B polypeptide 3 [Ceratitis capitata]|uniref:transcription elongation factor B polypeptide 3 n=1 Tax=Ceratitis capitata TaxID=7213 RepID=UPI000329B3F2|nr:transcription elongation factor B polypeptide 3 [Ceratitis capitata]